MAISTTPEWKRRGSLHVSLPALSGKGEREGKSRYAGVSSQDSLKCPQPTQARPVRKHKKGAFGAPFLRMI